MDYMPPIRRADNLSGDIEALQPKPNTEFHSIDPNVRYLWIISRGIFWTIVSMFGLVFLLLAGTSSSMKAFIPIGIAIYLVMATTSMLWPFFAYRHWGYAIRDYDFLIRSGVIFKRVAAIPFARIQHVDSDAGPIERAFGLANLEIHTAGSGLGSLSVPGLQAEQAEALRDYLSEVGHTHANL